MAQVSGPPPLAPQQVHLWTQPLQVADGEYAAFAEVLSKDERDRANRFLFERDRRRFTIARGRLRQILGLYLQRPPGQIAFSYNGFGKPAAEGSGPLRFNLSHSGDLAVYAFTAGREIGVDIELVKPGFQIEAIPERFFALAEASRLRSLAPAEQLDAFFECWTRKEAYVKARAEGLSIRLDSFEVTLGPGEPAAFLRNAAGFSMASFRLPPGLHRSRGG